jgi:hypothetical protein
MDYTNVAGRGSGRYYDSRSSVHDLGRFEVQSGHVTIVESLPNSMHVTWQLIGLREDGTQYPLPPDGYHVKLYHWYDIAPDGGSVSFNSGNWENIVDRVEGYDGLLRDDIVDADSELRPYSDELAGSFCEYLRESWEAGSTAQNT